MVSLPRPPASHVLSAHQITTTAPPLRAPPLPAGELVIKMASSVDCYARVGTGNVILGSILTAGTFIAYVPQVRPLPHVP